jgi:hypothetical protein
LLVLYCASSLCTCPALDGIPKGKFDDVAGLKFQELTSALDPLLFNVILSECNSIGNSISSCHCY